MSTFQPHQGSLPANTQQWVQQFHEQHYRQPHCLIVGAGDVGSRYGEQLAAAGWKVTGIRRQIDKLPASITGLPLNVFDVQAEDLQAVTEIDALVYSVTPSERSDAGYQKAYVAGVEAIIGALTTTNNLPKFWLHFSSSRVWAQKDGSWVDETTPISAPDNPTQSLIDGENLAKSLATATSGSDLMVTRLRFSGIYGKSLESLQRRSSAWRTYPLSERGADSSADQANAGRDLPLVRWTNRIHADDAAGFAAYITNLWLGSYLGLTGVDVQIHDLYAVTDNEPAQNITLAQWAQQLEAAEVSEQACQDGDDNHKRISNERLKASGYTLRYPSFREGYAPIFERPAE